MSDEFPWSEDHDPDRDPALSRMLRAGGGEAPLGAVDWERLHAKVMGLAAGQLGARRAGSASWYEIQTRWVPLAAAAVLAAVALVGAMLATAPSPLDPELAGTQPPEAVAVARMVAAYPDDAVLASLVGSATGDETTEWSGE
jgi:hypothetical protein